MGQESARRQPVKSPSNGFSSAISPGSAPPNEVPARVLTMSATEQGLGVDASEPLIGGILIIARRARRRENARWCPPSAGCPVQAPDSLRRALLERLPIPRTASTVFMRANIHTCE